jgi:hypothetical protein
MKDPVEANLDNIVNMTSLKLKELINKKQAAFKTNSLLKGQKNVLESDIAYNQKEIKDKETMLGKMVEELRGHQTDIEELEKEINSILKLYNNKNDDFKNTILNIDKELENVKITNGVEETMKKSELRSEYERYLQIKNHNKNLMEELYNARRDLYHIEVKIIACCIFSYLDWSKKMKKAFAFFCFLIWKFIFFMEELVNFIFMLACLFAFIFSNFLIFCLLN